MGGYTGSILNVDLSKRSITALPTAKYEDWVGGHGMGSALFFERVNDKTIDGFHPDNLLTFMASPLSGTLVPSGAARTEVQSIGVQSWPVGWFTRSNFGGRFAAMLKYAGWDGIVIQGKADSQVWIDIRDHEVKIRDCEPLSLSEILSVATFKRPIDWIGTKNGAVEIVCVTNLHRKLYISV